MGLTALLLVLLGAVIHAGWNFAAKKAGGDSRFSFFSSIIMAVVWAPLALSLGWHIVPNWGWVEWLLVALSGLVHWLYFVCLLTGYRKSDFTVVYPLARGSAPLLSSVVAVLVFGEALSALGVAGIMSVAFGVFLIAGGPGLFKAGHDPARHDRLMTGLFWGTATGVLIASYTVLDAYVVKVIAVSPILLDYWANILRMPIAAIPILRDPAEAKHLWRLQWKYAAVVAVLSPAAYVCVLYAMQMAPVSHVAPARELSMLFAAVIGGQLLGEQDRWLRIAGAGAIALGVMLLVAA